MGKFLIAYVDPGSGAMLVQAIIASIVGAGTWFVNLLFRRSKTKQEADRPTATPEDCMQSLKSKTQLLREMNQ